MFWLEPRARCPSGDPRRTANRGRVRVAAGGVLALLVVGCGADPAPIPLRKGEGEACQVSTECGAGLRCLEGVCATGGCRSPRDCQGLLPAGCEAWACLAGECTPACYADGGPVDAEVMTAEDAAPADALLRSDALPRPDAAEDAGTTAEDAAPVSMDAAPMTMDAAPMSTDAAPVGTDAAPVGMDAAPVGMDAAPVGPDGGGVSCDPTPRAPAMGDLLINEILADPAEDISGDANGDGTRDTADDEFVEIANVSGHVVQLAGVTVADATALRHRFAARTLSCGQVVVVFGGGNTSAPSWQASWVPASTGSLLLNNSGDTVRVGTSTAALASLASEAYGTSANANQSIVRSVELSSSPFVQHTAHPQAAGRIQSPGVRVNGQPF